MGLSVTADPPRKIETQGREWGTPVEGVSLSIAPLPGPGANGIPDISVVMKNNGGHTWALTIPGWIQFHRVESTAPPTAFGARMSAPVNTHDQIDIRVGPGDATEAQIPLGILCDMKPGRQYPVCVVSTLSEGVTLRSNTITITPSRG